MTTPVLDTEEEWALENIFTESGKITPHAQYVHKLWSRVVKDSLENPNWDPLAEMRRGDHMAHHVVAMVILEMRGHWKQKA